MNNKNPTKSMGMFIYPFFLIHMLAFGLSGFFMAYGSDVDIVFLYMHGGIAITVYIIFYLVLFGIDEVMWLFINSILGILGIATQVNWLLSAFGKSIAEFPFYIHFIPFMYYILYTFLIRQAVLDLSQSRNNLSRRRFVEGLYIFSSLSISAFFYFY